MERVTDTTIRKKTYCNGIDNIDLEIIGAVQKGIPLASRPYHAIGIHVGIDEDEVIARLQQLVESGIIKRFGVVLRHHELGYQSNAMVVWNIPDMEVKTFTDKMVCFPFVTLCYRRPRRLPHWPYNIFSMIHGKGRSNVLNNVDEIQQQMNAFHFDYEVLFSKRRFKQRGALYLNSSTHEYNPMASDLNRAETG